MATGACVQESNSSTRLNELPGDGAAPHHSLQPYLHPDPRRSLFQLLNTAIPFAALWYLMLLSMEYSYWAALLLAMPAAGLLVRLFIIQHDCGHGSFLRHQSVNNAIGFVIGVLTLTPYGYWRRTHAIHHATSGNLDRRDFGDITTLTVKEYQALSQGRRLMYRLYRHPLVLFGLGPAYLFIFKHRFPADIPWTWKREWRSVLWTNLAIVGVLALASQTIGITTFLKVQLPITLLAGSAGVWLFYIQHQFEETYWRNQPEWDYHEASLRGSSYYDLPAVINWFTGNIGVHHVHHLCSRIPNYRLHECLRENDYLQDVTRLTLRDSLRCVGLSLWDEDAQHLIAFRDLTK
jgi:omega-6 fatty acid desaturase (delta-12 desaturase)